MRVISKTGADRVEYPPGSGNVYEPEDGVYDLPEPVALELTRKHAAQWVAESAADTAARRARSAKLRNPREAADTITQLTERVAVLEARCTGYDQALAYFEDVLVEPTALDPAEGGGEAADGDDSDGAAQGAGADPVPDGGKPARKAPNRPAHTSAKKPRGA